MCGVMRKRRVIFFDIVLILFDEVFQTSNQIFSHFHLVYINFRLLFCQVFLVYFLTQLIKNPEVLLNQLLVLFVFEAFVGRKSTVGIEVGIADLVDDVFACSIKRAAELGFDEVEICIDGLLKDPTLGFDAAVHRVLLDECRDILFVEKDSSSHMVVVLFDTGIAARGFLPDTALAGAEGGNFLPVFALVHYNLTNIVWSNELKGDENYQTSFFPLQKFYQYS